MNNARWTLGAIGYMCGFAYVVSLIVYQLGGLITGEVSFGIGTIAAAAALEVEGVSSLAANLGSDIAELLGKKTLAKGVHIQMTDETVTAELSILMAYGHTIPEVGKAVQDAVKNAVESMTGLEIAAVNVNVGGITFPAAAKA